MTPCSRKRLKPTIKKIVITDKEDFNLYRVEVAGSTDKAITNITSAIMAKLENRGHKPEINIELENDDLASVRNAIKALKNFVEEWEDLGG